MQRTTFARVSPLATALFALLGATQVLAADPIEHQVQLIATIPSDSFYVVPSDTGWIGVAQRLEWKAGPGTNNGALQPLIKDFDVKHSSGSISAHLTDGTAYLFNGADTINLDVTFAGKKLTDTSQSVVEAADAGAGKRVQLHIAETAGQTLAPGSYSGIINMTFDAVVI